MQTNKREKKNHIKIRTHNLFHCILESLYWHLWNPLQNLNIYSAGGTISARFLFYFSAGELSYYFVFSHFRFAFAFDSANIKQINIKLNFLGSMAMLSYSYQLLLAGSSYWSCQIAIVNHCQYTATYSYLPPKGVTYFINVVWYLAYIG